MEAGRGSGESEMRKIDKIIIHCADTPPDMDIGFVEIDEWHHANGWMSPTGISCGYHYIIRRDGRLEIGRPETEIGAHCKGQNRHSVGVCMVGGKGGCNFTAKQWGELHRLIVSLSSKHHTASVHGHNEFSSKECPTFDVRSWWYG